MASHAVGLPDGSLSPLIEDEELEAIEIHTIDIGSFVPRQEFDRRFFDTPYYITPNEPVGRSRFNSTSISIIIASDPELFQLFASGRASVTREKLDEAGV
jgi:hypothetical protein